MHLSLALSSEAPVKVQFAAPASQRDEQIPINPLNDKMFHTLRVIKQMIRISLEQVQFGESVVCRTFLMNNFADSVSQNRSKLVL